MNRIKQIIKQIAHRMYVLRYPLIGGLIVGLFGVTVLRIDYISASERDEEAYNEALKTVETFTFDQASVDRILELKDAQIDIEPSFPSDRTNPF